MAKIKNKTIHSDDIDFLRRIADDLEFIGRPYRLDVRHGLIIQFVLPPHKRKKSKKEKKSEARNKRAESAARRS